MVNNNSIDLLQAYLREMLINKGNKNKIHRWIYYFIGGTLLLLHWN